MEREREEGGTWGWRLNEYWQMQQCKCLHNNSDDTAAMVTVDSLDLGDQEVAERGHERY